jgi:hypothetical protein
MTNAFFQELLAPQTWFSELPRTEASTSRHRTRSTLCLSFSIFLARFAGCKSELILQLPATTCLNSNPLYA